MFVEIDDNLERNRSTFLLIGFKILPSYENCVHCCKIFCNTSQKNTKEKASIDRRWKKILKRFSSSNWFLCIIYCSGFDEMCNSGSAGEWIARETWWSFSSSCFTDCSMTYRLFNLLICAPPSIIDVLSDAVFAGDFKDGWIFETLK